MITKPQKFDDYQTVSKQKLINFLCQKYAYTALGEASLGHTEPYNIYGVVQDASAPYIKNKPTA